MKYFLISDNTDTLTGLKLTGIDGVIVSTKEEAIAALAKASLDNTIGILMMTEKLAALCADKLSEMKLHTKTPLIVEIPDRHGTGRAADSITRYVREAVGIKI